MRILGIAAIVVVAVTLAGCGGSGKSYTLAASRSCLDGMTGVTHASTATNDLDAFARAAAGGADSIYVGGNNVVVLFERSSGDAAGDHREYEGDQGDTATGYRMGNVAVEWDKAPSDEQGAALKSCLA